MLTTGIWQRYMIGWSIKRWYKVKGYYVMVNLHGEMELKYEFKKKNELVFPEIWEDDTGRLQMQSQPQ